MDMLNLFKEWSYDMEVILGKEINLLFLLFN